MEKGHTAYPRIPSCVSLPKRPLFWCRGKCWGGILIHAEYRAWSKVALGPDPNPSWSLSQA